MTSNTQYQTLLQQRAELDSKSRPRSRPRRRQPSPRPTPWLLNMA